MKNLNQYKNSGEPKKKSKFLKFLISFTAYFSLLLLITMLLGSLIFWKGIYTNIEPTIIQGSNFISTFFYSISPQAFWLGIISAIIYAAISWMAYFINIILELRNETN